MRGGPPYFFTNEINREMSGHGAYETNAVRKHLFTRKGKTRRSKRNAQWRANGNMTRGNEAI